MIQVVIFDFFGVIYNPRTDSIMEGLGGFMSKLDQHKLRCGIASSSSAEHIREFINHTALENQFEIIVGAYDVQNTKPNPECYVKVAEFFNVTPEQCLVIDDSASAIHAAKQVGFHTILFATDAPDFQSINLNTYLSK